MSKVAIPKLGQYINVVNGFAFKSEHFLEYKKENTLPVIKIKNVANGDVNLKDVHFYQYTESLSKFVIEKGDTLIALTGNHPEIESQVVGLVSKYKLNEKALLNQRVAKIVSKNNKELNNEFLYYFLKDKKTHQYLASQSTGSANQANISKTDIENIDIEKPPIELQNFIAETLTNLDNKIDLLQRQNQTLEALAETIFKGRFGMANIEGALSTIKDLGKIICGKTPSKKISKYFGGIVPFLKIPDMHGKVFISETEDSLTVDGVNSQLNKLIPENSICVSCIATVGLVVINTKPIQTNQQVNSIVPYKDFYTYYIYLKMTDLKDDLLARASGGTATDNLNTTDFSNIEIEKPNDDILRQFHKEVSPFFQKIKSNSLQIKTLTNLRDTLLPKLMNGEVNVKA